MGARPGGRHTGRVTRTRYLAVVPLTALLVGAALTIAAPAAACACGGVAPSPGAEVQVGEEHAIVSYQDGVEQIDLLLGVLSESAETGLVFPTPSPAQVSLGDRADFEALDRVTAPQRVEEYDWWRVGGDGAAGGAPPTVLDQVQLGPIEATTLAASDTEGLTAWLAERSFALSPEVEAELDGYVERGWYFVAMRLTGDAPLDGGLDPLRFRFETDELVYPMAMSRAATTPQTVRLYLFGDTRQRVTFTDGGGTPAASFVSWAAPVEGTEVERFGDYLTVVELYFGDPAEQIRGDLAILADSDASTVGTEYRVVVPLSVLGIPLGWLLVGFGVLLVVMAAAAVAAVRARRS